MDKSKLTIWCNNDFKPSHQAERTQLLQGVGKHRLLMFADDQSGEAGDAQSALLQSEVAFGFPDPLSVVAARNIGWVQLNSAGYASYDHDEIKSALRDRGTQVTNSSAVYDEPCAQHLLAMIMSLTRQLPAALIAQRSDHSWPMNELRESSRLLNGQTFLLLGYGAIARRLVELLQPLQVKIVAMRRQRKGDEPVAIVGESEIEEVLSLADHVVNILPENDQTRLFLNAKRLRTLKTGAIVYNIGRGSTVDQEALITELNNGRIAAAYLDVTKPEPLPPDNPLWTTTNCFITPHSGGGHSDEKLRQVKHFLDNLRRFERGEELINRII